MLLHICASQEILQQVITHSCDTIVLKGLTDTKCIKFLYIYNALCLCGEKIEEIYNNLVITAWNLAIQKLKLKKLFLKSYSTLQIPELDNL